MWRAFDPLPVLEFWEKKSPSKPAAAADDDEDEAEEPLEELVQTMI